MTDGLWPILAIARDHGADTELVRALDRKRDEAIRVLRGDWKAWSSTERFYVLSHVYLAFIWTEREGHDIGRYWPFLHEVELELARAIDDPELSRANAALAQALFVLSEGGYPDKHALDELAAEVAARQQPTGRWNAFEVSAAERAKPHRKPIPEGFAAAHATLMALAGLDRWSRWQQHAAQREWRSLAGPNPIMHPATSAPPASVFQVIGGRRVEIAFALTQPSEIAFVNELRMEPENAPVFFPKADLETKLAKASSADERQRIERIREIRKTASQLVPSRHGITMQRTPSGLTLQVDLELYGPAATQALADRIKHGIEQAWRGTTSAGRLATSVRVTLRREGEPELATALPVYVPNMHVMPSTQRDGDTGDRPTTWPPWISEGTIAHEMGHYFGFADGYHVEVRDGFYFLVYDRVDDLMSCPYGAVQPGELEQLVHTYQSKG